MRKRRNSLGGFYAGTRPCATAQSIELSISRLVGSPDKANQPPPHASSLCTPRRNLVFNDSTFVCSNDLNCSSHQRRVSQATVLEQRSVREKKKREGEGAIYCQRLKIFRLARGQSNNAKCKCIRVAPSQISSRYSIVDWKSISLKYHDGAVTFGRE